MTNHCHDRARMRGDNTSDATGVDRKARLLAFGRRVAAITLIAAVLGACGDDGDGAADSGSPAPLPSGQATTTTPSESASATDVADDFLQLLASGDLARMGGMIDLATEGSPAWLYATHQIAALRSAGGPGGSTDVSVDGDSIVLCQPVLDASGNETEDCNTYGDFALDRDRLSDFSIDGVPMADRIRSGDPAGTAADGVTARIITAYQTARGDLALNLDITNGRDTVVAVADYEWALITSDGRQVAPSQLFAGQSPDVEPGATAAHVVYFEQAPLGGTLRFVAFADDFATEVRFDVAVPA